MRRPSLISWLVVIHMASTCCRYATAEYIRKPSIDPPNGLFLQPGTSGKLVCRVNASVDMRFDMWWESQNGTRIQSDSRIIVGSVTQSLDEGNLQRKIGQLELTVEAVGQDEGDDKYTCKVQNLETLGETNHRSVEVTVGNRIRFESDIRHFEESSGVRLPYMNITTKQKFVINVKYRSYLKPTLYWTKHGSEEPLKSNPKYNIKEGDSKISLIVSKHTVEDAGIYVLHGDNGITKNNFSIKVYVTAKPVLTMDPVYVRPFEEATFNCTSVGFPRPTINFAFFPCDSNPWQNCSKSVLRKAVDQFGLREPNTQDYITIEHFTVPQANVSGFVVCAAENSMGSAESVQADLLISDYRDPVAIRKISPEAEIVSGDRVTILCAASVYSNTNESEFFLNGKPLDENDGITFQDSYENYSYVRRLVIEKVRKSHEGSLKCRVKTIDSKMVESSGIEMRVLEPESPRIIEGSDLVEITQKAGESGELQCNPAGLPRPSIVWLKDNDPLEMDNRIQLNGSSLHFAYLKKEDSGHYRCRVENREGVAEKSWTLNVVAETVEKTWIYTGVVMVIVLVLIVVMITSFYCKKKREVAAMREAGLVTFEAGNLDQLNPDLPLDEQTDLLPYDSRYEFPKDRLKLGRQLGSGAFGVVMKATAYGLLPDECETTVAVKMVRKQTDNVVMRALISELKIMIHLGRHSNVVNLLGAITKNVAKKELMVIVEYCPFGNVQDYLFKHRRNFVNQFLETGEIDSIIDKSQYRLSDNGYINSRNYSNDTNNNAGSTDGSNMTYVTYIHDNSNYVRQPGYEDPQSSPCYINHAFKDDPNLPVTTTDLIYWSAQIANGMEYLTRRQVIHGDLAARNVLLGENNVVKICDFGLARSLYHRGDNYFKKGDDPLPFKWLALESIENAVFSRHSDVWSFGILLWELFSLATNPYPGMENSKELFEKLRQGYRMERPPYANQAIYSIMRQCWREQPLSRPSFWELKAQFSTMLPEPLKEVYLDLNEPYLIANNDKRPSRVDADCLSTAEPPPEPAPPVPGTYLNSTKTTPPEVISMVHLDQTKMNNFQPVVAELNSLPQRSAAGVSNPGYTSAVNVKSL